MDLILLAHKMAWKVLVMLEAASQMTVTTVLSARAEGEHRNATWAETAILFEDNYVSHSPRPVAIRVDPDGCFVLRTWTENIDEVGHHSRSSQWSSSSSIG